MNNLLESVMAPKIQNVKLKRDRTNENFGKCVKTVTKQCDKLWWKYQADVYLLVRRKGKIRIYDTNAGSFWLPTQEDIVSIRATRTINSNCFQDEMVSCTG
jgi:hypothetical protein